jgi:hypothetical protein
MKNYCVENPNKNTYPKISNFGGFSKFLKPIVFGQILAILGRFYCIDNG